MKPVIGIVSKHYREYEKHRVAVFVNDDIKQAIFDQGGIAIGIIPPQDGIHFVEDDWKDTLTVLEREELIQQISLCDGILLQGGTRSDLYEHVIAKYCYDNDIPILGICMGQNIMARAVGGTLSYVSDIEKHEREFDEYAHSIKINPDSMFYNIIQKEEIMVNSRHRKTVKTCPGLNIVAVCEDGYPDVIEAPDKTFYLGVKFHPENLYRKDENMKKIFRALIQSAMKNR